jgi:hypothetical protein
VAYELTAGESLPDGIRRILDEQLAGAIEQLSGRGDDDQTEAIHDARKRFKKSRAALRLVRAEIGGKRFRRENAVLRDAGRVLSPIRDAQVLVETATALNQRARETDAVSDAAWRRIRDALARRRARISSTTFDAEGAAASVLPEIEAVRRRVAELPLKRDAFAAIRPGVDRSYRRGARAFAHALDHREEEAWHEWRKRAKDLWYHLRILRNTGPIGDLVALADRLGDVLGLEHDHAVLAEVLENEIAPAMRADADLSDVLAMIAARRRELQDEAIPLGRMLYAEKRKAFLARLEAYWDVWRASAGQREGSPSARIRR